MIICQEKPSISFATFLEKAYALDWSPIVYLLTESRSGPQWKQAKACDVLAQYITFLYLRDAYPQYALVPSSDVDQVWHCHILDTQKYAEDCDVLFGRMVHHSPYLGRRGEQDRRHQYSAYGVTQALMQNILGRMQAHQVSQPADCEPI
jgi:hypothetical protein